MQSMVTGKRSLQVEMKSRIAAALMARQVPMLKLERSKAVPTAHSTSLVQMKMVEEKLARMYIESTC